MSMLAEPRQRKRYNLVPRGKALYEDDDRFGTKMLEKMGWSKGKGLGTNEDGSKDFVRVRYKNDVNGFGYEERDDQWTQHEESFTGLLKSLHGVEEIGNLLENDDVAIPTNGFGFQSEPKESKGKLKDNFSGESLEQKSKNSKARVHYKKFTRGKDLSRYSEKDLASIFGKKAVEEKTANGINAQIAVFTSVQDCSEEKGDEKSNSAGVPTINTGLSVNDYFKMKMDLIKSKTSAIEKKDDETLPENECNEGSKKNKKQKRSTEVEETTIEELEKEASKKKKKKNKEPYLLLQENDQLLKENLQEHFSNTNIEYSDNVFGKIKTKKSKKSEKKITSVTEEIKDETNVSLAVYNNQHKIEESKIKKKQNSESINCALDMYTVQTSHLLDKSAKEIKSEEILPNNITVKTKANSENDSCKMIDEEVKNKKPKKSKKNEKITLVTEEINDEPNVVLKVSHNLTVEPKNPDIRKESNTKKMLNLLSAISPLDKHISLTADLIGDESPKQIKSTERMTNMTENTEALKKCKISSKEENNAIECPSSDSNLEALTSQLNSFNIYTISSFCAEKFRNVDLNSFTGSSMSQIIGYSLSDDIELKIKTIKNHEDRILQMWNCTLNKYNSVKPKRSKYYRYLKEANKARRFRERVPHLCVKSYKRQKVFSGL